MLFGHGLGWLQWLVATFGPKFIWDDHSFLTVLAILVNLVNGVLMIIANRKFFNNLDELQRKIHLEALGISLGLAVIVGLSFSLLDQTNLIPFDAEIGFLVGFIGIIYMIALLINRKPLRMTNKLKVLRAEYDMTQQDLAKAVDVSRQTINAIEKQKFDPSLVLAMKLSRLFKHDIEEIFIYNEN